jgi:hypothetical protein
MPAPFSRVNKESLAYSIVAILVLLVAYPLSPYLPSWVSWENGPVENAQVVILVFGMIQALRYQRTTAQDWKWLWRGAALIWFICAVRELSWGAVFLDPIGMSEEGPFFSSRQLWYKPAIMPALIISILFFAFMMIKNRSQQLLAPLQRSGGLPWIEFILATFCMMVSTAAEEHLGLTTGLTGAAAQNLEELAEFSAYLFLLAGQARLRYHQYLLYRTR